MGPHRANCVLAAKKHPVQVGAVHGMPVLQACMLGVVWHGTLLKPGNARVIHDHVKPAALLEHLGCDAQPIVFLPHIQWHITRLASHRMCNGTAQFMLDVRDVNEAAVVHQHACNRFPNALGRAGDDRHLRSQCLMHARSAVVHSLALWNV